MNVCDCILESTSEKKNAWPEIRVKSQVIIYKNLQNSDYCNVVKVHENYVSLLHYLVLILLCLLAIILHLNSQVLHLLVLLTHSFGKALFLPNRNIHHSKNMWLPEMAKDTA